MGYIDKKVKVTVVESAFLKDILGEDMIINTDIIRAEKADLPEILKLQY